MATFSGTDTSMVKPPGNFEPIPAGKYVATIIESAMKPTKAGTGEYLQLTFRISEGPHKNGLIPARLNLKNPNPMAVQIARSELSAICRAVGVMGPKDSTELHNLPLIIHVKCVKRADTGEITNEIHGYSAKNSPKEGGPPQGSTPAPPWAR